MKTILIAAAAAFAFLSPAAAQPAQGGATHQGHDTSMHAGHDMPQHQGQSDDAHKTGDHAKKMDCCADRDGNGKMDCCEKMQTSEAQDCCADHAQPTQDHAKAAPANKG